MLKRLGGKLNNDKEIIEEIVKQFPFGGYMDPANDLRNGYLNIAESVKRILPVGSRVLDFGCGPCDKLAVLSSIGYKCWGFDDFSDDWHKKPGVIDAIRRFAIQNNISLIDSMDNQQIGGQDSFDLIMLNDVVEHLHDSPGPLLNNLIEKIKDGGYLLITVPNAVNIRKRISVFFGGTNYPSFEFYYYYPVPYRGHIREYTVGDLRKMCEFLGLEKVVLTGCDHMLAKVPSGMRRVYLGITDLFPSLKDSIILIARKPQKWRPDFFNDRLKIDKILGRSTTFKYIGTEI